MAGNELQRQHCPLLENLDSAAALFSLLFPMSGTLDTGTDMWTGVLTGDVRAAPQGVGVREAVDGDDAGGAGDRQETQSGQRWRLEKKKRFEVTHKQTHTHAHKVSYRSGAGWLPAS